MKNGRIMLSGINSTASLAYLPAVSSRSSASQPAGDQVSMSLSPETFTGLVRDAAAMPEVRGEVVDAYKSQVQAGHYPTPDTIDGLVDLMGGAWVKAARS